MIDIHTHILPGVDDGSPDLETSLMMAEAAARSGVAVIAATCHSNQEEYQNYESEELRQRFMELQEALERERIPVQIVRGMEIWAVGRLEEKIRSGRLVPLNGSRFFLVEVPFDAEPEEIRARLTEILDLGKVPVLAHPERYPFYAKDIVRYCERFKEKGGKVQVNILSFAGFYGKEAMMGARKLCDAALADYYAGDIHCLQQEILMEKYIGGAW